jgi:hypothetical protein
LNVAGACRSAGILRVTFYKYLKVDPHFAERIELAKAMYARMLCISQFRNLLLEGLMPR